MLKVFLVHKTLTVFMRENAEQYLNMIKTQSSVSQSHSLGEVIQYNNVYSES